jgi:hypothetical protein
LFLYFNFWSAVHYLGFLSTHGHYHGRVDEYNVKTGNLRVDVGIDSKLARECGGFIPLEKLYKYFWNIAQNDNFAKYVADNRERNPI